MPRAVIDTTVLFAAAYRRDSAHTEALPILQGVDAGDLPEAVVLDYVLAETLNGLTTHTGHDAAVDLLDRLEENARFHIDSLNRDALERGKHYSDSINHYRSLTRVLSRICTPKGWGISTPSTMISMPLRRSIVSRRQRIHTTRVDR